MKSFGIVVAVVVALIITTTPPVLATDTYLLTQEIALIDCTNTQTDDGLGQTTNTECDGLIAPTVDTQSAQGSQLIITGTFDPATMLRLRVMINGRTYLLGVDPQLTINGSHWRLDLTSLLPPLAPGTYTAVVEVETADSKLLRSTSQMQITVVPTPGESTQPPVRDGQNPLAGTGESLVYILIGGAVLLVAGALLLLGLHYHRRR